MFNATLDQCTRHVRVNFSATDAEEFRVPHRNGAALKTDCEHALAEAVGRALRATGYPALCDVQIEIERGIVVLWGRVPTYYQKQLAQTAAHQVDGTRGIANGIEVVCCR